jgi:hypothetical protein
LYLKHQDIGETRSELNNVIQSIEQVAGQDTNSKLLIAKINKLFDNYSKQQVRTN